MNVTNSNAKGAIAELSIAAAAAKLGVGVYKPLFEHARADLIFEIGDCVFRVQCKWAQLSPAGDVVIIRTSGSRYTPKGYVYSTYGAHEIELLAAYCGDLDRCFLLPIERFAGMRQIQLRLSSPRNNQRACINLADDFVFDGAIAQLGERLGGTQKVVGSSPTSSIERPDGPVTVGSNPFRDQLGYWMERVAGGEQVLVTFRGKPRVRLSPA